LSRFGWWQVNATDNGVVTIFGFETGSEDSFLDFTELATSWTWDDANGILAATGWVIDFDDNGNGDVTATIDNTTNGDVGTITLGGVTVGNLSADNFDVDGITIT
jgi:FlaG/FlaF family flagellin (archaellin)